MDTTNARTGSIPIDDRRTPVNNNMYKRLKAKATGAAVDLMNENPQVYNETAKALNRINQRPPNPNPGPNDHKVLGSGPQYE